MFGVKTRILKNIAQARWYLNHYRIYFNRDKIIEDYLKKHKIRKLSLGCWPYPMESWLNTDLYGNEKLVPLDLTKRFPLPDSSIHYIFCEHTIEHFDLKAGIKILEECFRVLKPGGKLRFATPDLNFLVELYSKQKTKTQKDYIGWASDQFLKDLGVGGDTVVINNFVRAWGHEFIYDYKTLKQILEKAGFKEVTRHKPGQSKDRVFKDIESHWKSIGSKEFNDLETFAVEAVKPKARA